MRLCSWRGQERNAHLHRGEILTMQRYVLCCYCRNYGIVIISVSVSSFKKIEAKQNENNNYQKNKPINGKKGTPTISVVANFEKVAWLICPFALHLCLIMLAPSMQKWSKICNMQL